MQSLPQQGTVVQHKTFGHGSITKIRLSESEIVVRFNKPTYVTLTFAISDFDSFLTIVDHEDTATDPGDRDKRRLDDANKRCLCELEKKLALKAANKNRLCSH